MLIAPMGKAALAFGLEHAPATEAEAEDMVRRYVRGETVLLSDNFLAVAAAICRAKHEARRSQAGTPANASESPS